MKEDMTALKRLIFYEPKDSLFITSGQYDERIP